MRGNCPRRHCTRHGCRTMTPALRAQLYFRLALVLALVAYALQATP